MVARCEGCGHISLKFKNKHQCITGRYGTFQYYCGGCGKSFGSDKWAYIDHRTANQECNEKELKFKEIVPKIIGESIADYVNKTLATAQQEAG